MRPTVGHEHQRRSQTAATEPQIAAIFATMNRAATAVSCVRALASQTRPPDLVVVADNVSADDTVEQLENLRDLPFPLVIHRMNENRGNAGGVEEAMELAFVHGMDAVWILDDDSWPRPEALAELAMDGLMPGVVRHSLQVDPKTNRFTWPLQVADGSGGWRLADGPEEMPVGDFVRTRIMWTGALVPGPIREHVGPVNGRLFIRGEDEEYPWRIEQAGFGFEAATRSILDHPGPDDLIRFSWLGKSFFFERGLVDWKLYYKVRNMVWLKRKQSGVPKAAAMAIAYALATAWIDGAQRLPLVWEAVRDGWRGRLGRWPRQG
jgi:rhamnopyranosyl-N-acetylglucosaminyl-diphospho-decaprenol beta-1,3/1,4-galactofuranosyltransferase